MAQCAGIKWPILLYHYTKIDGKAISGVLHTVLVATSQKGYHGTGKNAATKMIMWLGAPALFNVTDLYPVFHHTRMTI